MIELRTVEGNEFSRLLPAEQLKLLPVSLTVEATPSECEALAARFELRALSSLSARLTIDFGAQHGEVLVKGEVSAEATQACVVTLVPLPVTLLETFEVTFAPEDEAKDSKAEDEAEMDGARSELLPREGIDLGEVVAQQLFIALDPYPRAASAEFTDDWAKPGDGPAEKKSPFAVLEGLKGSG